MFFFNVNDWNWLNYHLKNFITVLLNWKLHKNSQKVKVTLSFSEFEFFYVKTVLFVKKCKLQMIWKLLIIFHCYYKNESACKKFQFNPQQLKTINLPHRTSFKIPISPVKPNTQILTNSTQLLPQNSVRLTVPNVSFRK